MLPRFFYNPASRPPAGARAWRSAAASLVFLTATEPVVGKPFVLTTLDRGGRLAWSDALVPGICSVEVASAVDGNWQPARNVFATNKVGGVTLALNTTNHFFRVRSVTLDDAGNIIICESDYGFVRRIRFQKMTTGH